MQNKTNTHVKRIVIIAPIICLVIVGIFLSCFILNYKNGIKAIDNQNFISAQQYFDKIPYSQRIFPRESAYIYAGVLMEKGDYLESLKAFDQLENIAFPASITERLIDKIIEEGYCWNLYTTIDELNNISLSPYDKNLLTSKIYLEGQTKYRAGQLIAARDRFNATNNYNRSSDYLLLIQAKLQPYNIQYNNLFELIGFEDTAEIILNYNTFIYYFLNGKWKEQHRSNSHYFQINIETRKSSYNLPNFNVDGHYQISHGIYSVGPIIGERVNYFKFSIIDKDTISVYCYKDKNTYKLYRQ